MLCTYNKHIIVREKQKRVLCDRFCAGHPAARRPAEERFHISGGQQDLQKGSSEDPWFLVSDPVQLLGTPSSHTVTGVW